MNNGIVFSFHVRESSIIYNYCYKQIKYSLSTLRKFNWQIPVKIYISPPSRAISTGLEQFDNVEVIPFENTCPDGLNEEWIGEGYGEFLLHRWDNAFNALKTYNFDNILYLDTDTIFHGDPEKLFLKYAKTSQIIAREDNSDKVLNEIEEKFSMNDGQFILNKKLAEHHKGLMDYTYRYINRRLELLSGRVSNQTYHDIKWLLIQLAATNYFRINKIPIKVFDVQDVMLHVEVENLDTSSLILHHYYSGNTVKFVPKEFL